MLMRFRCLTVFILTYFFSSLFCVRVVQASNNFKDCSGNLAGSDILQKHSINSLLEHNEMILPADGESARRVKIALKLCSGMKVNFLIKFRPQRPGDEVEAGPKMKVANRMRGLDTQNQMCNELFSIVQFNDDKLIALEDAGKSIGSSSSNKATTEQSFIVPIWWVETQAANQMTRFKRVSGTPELLSHATDCCCLSRSQMKNF
jgi:hypothetical protein